MKRKSFTHVGSTPVSIATNYPLHVPFKLTKHTLIVDTVIEEILKGSRHDKVFLERTLEKFNVLLQGPIDSIVSIEEEWTRRVEKIEPVKSLSTWGELQLYIIGHSIKSAVGAQNEYNERVKNLVF